MHVCIWCTRTPVYYACIPCIMIYICAYMYTSVCMYVCMYVCTLIPCLLVKNKFKLCTYLMQLWARAFHDQTYHAAINTTNGVESQNMLLKYSYLPRKKNLTLSQLVIILYDEFIPESHHKYLYLNYRMPDTYR